MSTPSQLYRPSLALLTDLYQLTMAQGYWRAGVAEHEAVFHVSFRKNPFQGGFALACGLADVVDTMQSFRFTEDDLAHLERLTGSDRKPLFDPEFLQHLEGLRLKLDVDAPPEGTVVFPHEPLLRVRGPVLQAQLLETAVLNILNFQTLVATKAARVCLAARGAPVVEFGLRRAQGIDGGLAATRAAYVGGCVATSNVLGGKLHGVPVRGTHAHSWVMFFDDERTAFLEYAKAMPNNCVFLVDTYETLAGVRHAIETGRWLRERGHEMAGIRLDSGDLAYLSIEARKLLDAAGFPDASIVASNDLDEHVVASLMEQGARIDVWGVGTNLVTGGGQCALGGVYKLAARRAPGAEWKPVVKLSEQSAKVSTPGMLQVRRYRGETGFVGDVVWDELTGIESPAIMVDPLDATRRKTMSADLSHEDLLKPVFRAGALVGPLPSLADARQLAQDQLASLHAGIKRLMNPHEHPVGLERRLFDLKTRLVLEARSAAMSATPRSAS